MKFIVDKFLMVKKCLHFLIIQIKGKINCIRGLEQSLFNDWMEIGWSFWPKEHLVEHVNKLLINSVSCVNAAAQFAGIAALDGPDDSIHE